MKSLVHSKEEQINIGDKCATSKSPRLELIPIHGLEYAADRYALGLEAYKEKAYNAINKDAARSLLEREWLLSRCAHAIAHAYQLIAAIRDEKLAEAEHDAGALAWAGLTLGEAVWEAKKTKQSRT